MTRLLLLPLLALAACANAPDGDAPTAIVQTVEAPERILVGDALPGDAALSTDALIADAEALDGQTVVVEGEVTKVCQMAGCWLTLVGADGQPVRINVPRDDADDYLFTFPQGVEGRTARVAGTFTVEEESVEILRHYAEDEGASPDEIAAITEPRRTLALEATGAELTEATENA